MGEMSEWEILARQIVEDGFSREGLVNRITAELCLAEERGRQSATEEAAKVIEISPAWATAAEIAYAVRHLDRSKMKFATPCEWADLAGLEGRELRERLKSRAHMFSRVQGELEDMECVGTDAEDRVLLADMIYAKELAVTREFERLWSEHVDSYEKYLGTDDGLARICADLGPQYVGIIVHRATAKKVRAAAEYPVAEGTVVS